MPAEPTYRYFTENPYSCVYRFSYTHGVEVRWYGSPDWYGLASLWTGDGFFESNEYGERLGLDPDAGVQYMREPECDVSPYHIWKIVGDSVFHGMMQVPPDERKWSLMMDTTLASFLNDEPHLIRCDVRGNPLPDCAGVVVGPAGSVAVRYFTDGEHTMFRYNVAGKYMEVKSKRSPDIRDYVRSMVTLEQVLGVSGLHECLEDGQPTRPTRAINKSSQYFRNASGMWKVDLDGGVWYKSGHGPSEWLGTSSTVEDILVMGGVSCDCNGVVVTKRRLPVRSESTFKWEQPLITICEFVTSFVINENQLRCIDYQKDLGLESDSDYLEVIAKGGHLLEIASKSFATTAFDDWYSIVDAAVICYRDLLLIHRGEMNDGIVIARFDTIIKNYMDG
jgi:hypothetical protein